MGLRGHSRRHTAARTPWPSPSRLGTSGTTCASISGSGFMTAATGPVHAGPRRLLLRGRLWAGSGCCPNPGPNPSLTWRLLAMLPRKSPLPTPVRGGHGAILNVDVTRAFAKSWQLGRLFYRDEQDNQDERDFSDWGCLDSGFRQARMTD